MKNRANNGRQSVAGLADIICLNRYPGLNEFLAFRPTGCLSIYVLHVFHCVQGGSDIEVDDDNKQEYVDLMFKYYMFERIKVQLEKLLLGFYEVGYTAMLLGQYLAHDTVDSCIRLNILIVFAMCTCQQSITITMMVVGHPAVLSCHLYT